MNTRLAERGLRRGAAFIDSPQLFPLEQEAALELPLGFATEAVPDAPVAIVLHAYHLALLPEIRTYLAAIPFPADLFVSTDTEAKRETVAACFATWPAERLTVQVTPNRGRDIGPKLVGFAAVHDRYTYVLHLHTKQSMHDERLAGWRGYLLQSLLGSPAVVHAVFAAFAQSPRLGLLAPQHIDLLRPWVGWGENHAEAEGLARRMGFPLPRLAPLDFPSGSMFWARTAALRPLLDLQLQFEDFPEEQGQVDGTLAHAIERLYLLVCEQAGFDWIKVTARGQLHDGRGTVAVTRPEELARFLAHRPVSLGTMRVEERPPVDVRQLTTPLPKPRRVPLPLWRDKLGDPAALPAGLHVTAVLTGDAAESAALADDVRLALGDLPSGVAGELTVAPALSRGEALRAGFATGAGLVLLFDRPGLPHPGCAASLASMAHAHGGRALIEAACVPELRPKSIEPDSLAVEWAGSPLLAVPRPVFEATGGFDDALAGPAADLDLSRRAAVAGFQILRCPLATFYPFDMSV